MQIFTHMLLIIYNIIAYGFVKMVDSYVNCQTLFEIPSTTAGGPRIWTNEVCCHKSWLQFLLLYSHHFYAKLDISYIDGKYIFHFYLLNNINSNISKGVNVILIVYWGSDMHACSCFWMASLSSFDVNLVIGSAGS